MVCLHFLFEIVWLLQILLLTLTCWIQCYYRQECKCDQDLINWNHPLNIMCGRFKTEQVTYLISLSDLNFSFHTWPLVVGPRLKLQSQLSLVSGPGTWIYALKIREQACSHKASSVHSLFDFCSSIPNLTLGRENTSPIWESVPVCKGKGERATHWKRL